ncbi:aluminum activated malate transporter family protein [Trifolium repens]|nr:aluminum activated malate transporter family protein [Trifolium repens]
MVTPNVEDTTRFTHTLGTLVKKSWANLVKVTNMLKEIGQDDPRKVIHSFKVGLALVLIYILHHFRPSFYGFRENIIWAVLTVVLVFEFSVGATLGKGFNRMLATWLAGALGAASNKIATLCGDTGKVVMTSIFLFVIAERVTFLRFSPKLKARYDYGMIIFIVTFCLISLSDLTGNKLLEVAYERLLTIIIGSCIAITVCIFICPVWIGEDLHNKIVGNIERVADFLEGFGDEYFNNSENIEAGNDKQFLERYKSILCSKSSEETMAVLARWEPRHGKFGFRHPWKQYLKIGNLTRFCAYKLEALGVYLQNSKSPYEFRSRIQESCTTISLESGKALKESSLMIKNMSKLSTPKSHVLNAKNAAESLKSILRTNPWEGADHLEIIPASTVASLLIDIVICVDQICEAVDELGSLANFVSCDLLHRGTVQPISDTNGSVHIVTVSE